MKVILKSHLTRNNYSMFYGYATSKFQGFAQTIFYFIFKDCVRVVPEQKDL